MKNHCSHTSKAIFPLERLFGSQHCRQFTKKGIFDAHKGFRYMVYDTYTSMYRMEGLHIAFTFLKHVKTDASLSIGTTMESVGNPKTWVPYMYTKDCSQGFCSMYCPQWCRITFPPPPSVDLEESGTKFSPLVIIIISVLASGLLLVSYFAIISKYCRRKSSDRRLDHDEELQEVGISSFHQPINFATVGGLDESFIKSIPVGKYKKEDDVGGMDCSVCLGEFQENESLRILPKCSHCFHISCIDMWLMSHSSCPLCRASVTSMTNEPQRSSQFQIPSSPFEISQSA